MSIEIVVETAAALATYASVPSAFLVREVFDVVDQESGLGGLAFVPRLLSEPYIKDYDSLPDCHPLDWPGRFDVSEWGILTAKSAGRVVGKAAVAWSATSGDMLDGDLDAALLSDIRVAPDAQRSGVGRALFKAAEDFARARGAVRLKIETQNINVPACRFYASQGCALGSVRRFAYPQLPDEVQIVWYKDLGYGMI